MIDRRSGEPDELAPDGGRIQTVWDVGHALCFARTTDHGATWKGAGNKSIAETVLADDSFSPEISVGPDGAIYIVYWNRYSSTTIKCRPKALRITPSGPASNAKRSNRSSESFSERSIVDIQVKALHHRHCFQYSQDPAPLLGGWITVATVAFMAKWQHSVIKIPLPEPEPLLS